MNPDGITEENIASILLPQATSARHGAQVGPLRLSAAPAVPAFLCLPAVACRVC